MIQNVLEPSPQWEPLPRPESTTIAEVALKALSPLALAGYALVLSALRSIAYKNIEKYSGCDRLIFAIGNLALLALGILIISKVLEVT